MTVVTITDPLLTEGECRAVTLALRLAQEQLDERMSYVVNAAVGAATSAALQTVSAALAAQPQGAVPDLRVLLDEVEDGARRGAAQALEQLNLVKHKSVQRDVHGDIIGITERAVLEA